MEVRRATVAQVGDDGAYDLSCWPLRRWERGQQLKLFVLKTGTVGFAGWFDGVTGKRKRGIKDNHVKQTSKIWVKIFPTFQTNGKQGAQLDESLMNWVRHFTVDTNAPGGCSVLSWGGPTEAAMSCAANSTRQPGRARHFTGVSTPRGARSTAHSLTVSEPQFLHKVWRFKFDVLFTCFQF